MEKDFTFTITTEDTQCEALANNSWNLSVPFQNNVALQWRLAATQIRTQMIVLKHTKFFLSIE
jgi:hypothetical protein